MNTLESIKTTPLQWLNATFFHIIAAEIMSTLATAASATNVAIIGEVYTISDNPLHIFICWQPYRMILPQKKRHLGKAFDPFRNLLLHIQQ